MNIAINGLGRIGRLVVRKLVELNDNKIKLIAANSTANSSIASHLLNYDSTHGNPGIQFTYDDKHIYSGNNKIRLFHEVNPENIPWHQYNIDIVIECSGKFNTRSAAAGHLVAGARKVVISAPCHDADITIVIGANEHLLTHEHQIISVGSCTTNALAPIAKILHQAFNIQSGYVTTVHAYTSDQNILDNSHNDLRRARACSMSMIPTKTGAAITIGSVIPELANRLDGSAIRVPIPNVSLIDFTFVTEVDISVEIINKEISKAIDTTPMRNVIDVVAAPLVSIDFNHSSFSAVFDHYETKTVGNNFGRILAWYDNEYGIVNRIVDLCRMI